VATAIALTVVEPTMNGIGSDAFALVWDGSRLHGLNASGHSPAGWTAQRFAGQTQMPIMGWDCITVPGAVSAWASLSERFGKLPFAELFEPAIEYADRGFPVSPTISRQWQKQGPTMIDQQGFAQSFMPNGKAPLPGEIFRHPDQARTLEEIARTRGESFYRGALAEKIVAASRAGNGVMTAEDLAAHQADWVEPIGQEYLQGVSVHEIPPSGQGIAALMALGMLRELNLAATPMDSADSYHLQIEAMKLAFADVRHYVADPRAMRIQSSHLLDPQYLRSRAKLIDRKRAQTPAPGSLGGSDTIYLTSADAGGMMVSYIQSNFMGFGSGVVVPGTGISMQNRGSCFTLDPQHANCVGPRKRPFHTIIPAFATQRGKPLMSFGVMGADMQPQGHLQMITRLVDYQQNPQACADGPRWKITLEGQIALEHTVPDAVVAELARRGHSVRHTERWNMEYGAAQLIYRLDDGYVAASEPRRDGQAVAF
jgi:gamma-glutamyltranspeptidase/glutathione hydrolase